MHKNILPQKKTTKTFKNLVTAEERPLSGGTAFPNIAILCQTQIPSTACALLVTPEWLPPGLDWLEL